MNHGKHMYESYLIWAKYQELLHWGINQALKEQFPIMHITLI